jgi:mannose-6-phosphate isomerase-like protein (cupin superfamily)
MDRTPERREDNPRISPIVERREPKQPEWRRRAMEQHARNPWGAVTDLTEGAA